MENLYGWAKNLRAFSIMALATLLITTGLTGCIFDNEPRPIRQMREYMKEKYGDVEFEIDSYRPVQLVQDYDVVFAHVVGTDKATDGFSIERKKKDDKTVITDNYYGLLIREELEAKAYEVASKYFSNVKIYVDFVVGQFEGDEITASTPLDYVAKNKLMARNSLVVFVERSETSDEEFEQKTREFMDDWLGSDYGAMSVVRVSYLLEGMFEGITRANCVEIYKHGSYSVDISDSNVRRG